MKIALFFILVAVSSCFAVDAQLPAMDGKGKMTNDQIALIAVQFVGLVKLYGKAQKSGDPCQKQCVIEKMFCLLDQLAIVTNCHHQIIIIIAVACLPAECKTIAGDIGNCLMNKDAAAMMEIDTNICAHLIAALISVLKVLVTPLNVDIVKVVTDAVLSLAGWCTEAEMKDVMRCVAKLGCLAQGAVLQTVNGVLCLVYGTAIKPVGGALTLISDVSTVKAILTNLSCPLSLITYIVSTVLPGLLSSVIGAVGNIVGNTVGAVSGLTSIAGVGSILSPVTDTIGTLTGAVSGLGSTLGAVTGAANNIVGGLAGNTVNDALGTLTRTVNLGNIL